MKKIFLSSVTLLLFSCAFAQQDEQYSQYMFNHLSINPAYAGTREALNVAVLHRNQWVNIDNGAPSTSVLAIQGPIKNKKIGLGVELINDNIGPKNVFYAMSSYSYRLQLSNGYLSMGLRFGLVNYTIDWNLIKYRDQSDPYNFKNIEQTKFLTADFGVYYYNKSFYWGIAATHLNTPDLISPDTMKPGHLIPHIFSPIGMGVELKDGLILNPSLMVKYVKGAPVDIDINCNFLFNNKLWLGISYRMKYGVVALMQWRVTDKFKFGYAYDLGLNKIGRIGGASHEIMLGYDFNIKRTKTVSPRYL